MFGSYDITMCDEHKCDRKDTCHRYLQLQRARKELDTGDFMCSVFLIDNPSNCMYYWEEGKWNC